MSTFHSASNFKNKIFWKFIQGNHRGVFANSNFLAGDLIEVCPVILLPIEDPACLGMDGKRITGWGDSSVLDSYVFSWSEEKEFVICLGYGSLYNHSYEPNAVYHQNFDDHTIEIRAITEIKDGDEIYINYNKDPSCKHPVWFQIHGAQPLDSSK